MTNRPELKLEIGESVIGTLLFDQPKSGTNSNGEWNLYALNIDGKEKSYFASNNAHKTLKNCKKGDTVSIEHRTRKQGGSVYVVSLVGKSNLNGVQSERPIDTDLSIKWGMAFNNATRLACTDDELTPAGKVAIIKEIMPAMFKIARGLDAVLKAEQDGDDLPF